MFIKIYGYMGSLVIDICISFYWSGCPYFIFLDDSLRFIATEGEIQTMSMSSVPLAPNFSASNLVRKLTSPQTAPLQFSGLHRDAVIGADIRPLGTKHFADNRAELHVQQKDNLKFEHLKRPVKLGIQTLKSENATAGERVVLTASIHGKDVPVGFFPDELNTELIQRIQEGHEFKATMNGMQRYRVDGDYNHSLSVRLEYINSPKQAPNLEVRDSFQAAVEKLRKEEYRGFNMVQTIIPENIDTFEVQGRDVLERINYEQGLQGEATFFVNGEEVSRDAVNFAEVQTPSFTQKLTKGLQEFITNRLNQHYYENEFRIISDAPQRD